MRATSTAQETFGYVATLRGATAVETKEAEIAEQNPIDASFGTASASPSGAVCALDDARDPPRSCGAWKR